MCTINKQCLSRSKSVDSLQMTDNLQDIYEAGSFCRYSKKRRTASGSSMEFENLLYSNQETLKIKVENNDDVEVETSSLKNESLKMLYKKVEKLNDLFLEQNKLLTAIKQDIADTNYMSQSNSTNFGVTNMVSEGWPRGSDQRSERNVSDDGAKAGRRLLNAIECSHANMFDNEINNALIEMLNSNELKEYMVSATVKTLKPVVRNCMHHVITTMHREMLQHEQHQLIEHITTAIARAFGELEKRATALTRSVSRSLHSLRQEMERQQNQTDAGRNFVNSLRDLVEHILEEELREKRGEALNELLKSGNLSQFADQLEETEQTASAGADLPPANSPHRPHSTLTPMAQLLYAAQISKYMDDGDVSNAFYSALCCGDLTLVVAACRAAPAHAATRLPQHVLLSLVQQLATDLVQDTQLKCSYIEDAILNLDASDPTTRVFLPKVMGNVLSNLSRFLHGYPNHVATRRVKIIMLASSKLLS